MTTTNIKLPYLEDVQIELHSVFASFFQNITWNHQKSNSKVEIFLHYKSFQKVILEIRATKIVHRRHNQTSFRLHSNIHLGTKKLKPKRSFSKRNILLIFQKNLRRKSLNV